MCEGEVAATLLDGLADARLAIRVFLLLGERGAEPVEGFRVAPVVLVNRPLEGFGRLVPTPLLVKDGGNLIDGIGVVATTALDCAATRFDGFRPLTLLLKREAEIVLRRRVVAAALLDVLAKLFGGGGLP